MINSLTPKRQERKFESRTIGARTCDSNLKGVKVSDVQAMPENAELSTATLATEDSANGETKKKRGRRRFNPAEIAMAHQIKNLAPVGESIAYSALSPDIRKAVLPTTKFNLVEKGIVECEIDEEQGLLKSIRIDPEVWESYESDLVLPTPSVVAKPVTRRPINPIWTDEKYKIKLMSRTNPRRDNTHGFYNWQYCYKDGMSTVDYLYQLDYERYQQVPNKRTGKMTYFNGPSAIFLKQDVAAGNVGVYDSSLPDNDPNYWLKAEDIIPPRGSDDVDEENEETAESGTTQQGAESVASAA